MFRKILLVILLGPTSAFAHPLDMGLVQLDVNGARIAATLDMNPLVAASLLGLGDAALTPLIVQSRAAALRDAVLASGALRMGGADCRWMGAEATLEPQTVHITTAAECPAPAAAMSWSFPIVTSPKVPPSFQIIVRSRSNGEERVLLAERGREALDFEAGAARGFGRFVAMGIEHIGAAPNQWHGPEGWHLPEGLDHILFVVALVLAGGGFVSLLGTATGFTVGHSVTLALGALGWVHLPSRLVESAIALSIAVVAAEAFFQKVPKHRWKIATAFGLVHGLGFASAVAELNLGRAELVKALLGFNLGVEIGQAILIAIFFPLFLALRKPQPWGRYAIPTCSGVIFLCGSYWFVQRALGF